MFLRLIGKQSTTPRIRTSRFHFNDHRLEVSRTRRHLADPSKKLHRRRTQSHTSLNHAITSRFSTALDHLGVWVSTLFWICVTRAHNLFQKTSRFFLLPSLVESFFPRASRLSSTGSELTSWSSVVAWSSAAWNFRWKSSIDLDRDGKRMCGCRVSRVMALSGTMTIKICANRVKRNRCFVALEITWKRRLLEPLVDSFFLLSIFTCVRLTFFFSRSSFTPRMNLNCLSYEIEYQAD